MNDKTNLLGYNQSNGLASGTAISTLTNYNGVSTTDLISIWASPFNGGTGTTIYTDNTSMNPGMSLAQAISNSNNMNKQVKVAVFTVERNEDNKVVSSTFVKELWVEVKNGASLELSVAKQLDKDFDPSTTIIREIHSVTF